MLRSNASTGPADIATALIPGVLNELPLGIALLDTQGRIVYTNPALDEIAELGLGVASGNGRPTLLTLPPFCDSEEFIAGFSPLLFQERINFRWSLRRYTAAGNETEAVFRVQGFPLQYARDIEADSLLLIDDITEGFRLKTQLGRAQRMESVGSLASAVAHDFNNILTVILSSVHLLKKDLGEESRYRGPLEVIENTALSAGELAEQLLSLARPRPVEKCEIDLNATIRGIRPLLERVLREGITLDIELEPDIWTVQADTSQILHALVNLCINAQEAMSARGVISITTANVDRSTASYVEGGLAPAHYVILSVADEGQGIPPEIADRVFDPFFTTKEGGTGLGLSTAYSFAKEQGGTVTIYSEPGRGTRINVYLQAEPRSPRPDTTPRRSSADEVPGGTETILLVDDEPLLLELGAEILALKGYQVISAASGEEAVAIFSASPERIPLAILDMAMPGMSGLETLRALRMKDPELKAIISSGFHASREMRDMLDAEVDAFINKPYEIDSLAREVRTLLDAWTGQNG